MTWDYASDGGTDWPVQPGDLWEVGEHFVLCGDPEAGSSEMAASMVGNAPTIACTDPPWGAGIHAGFRTKSGLGPYVDYDQLLYQVLRSCAYASIVLIETGKRIAEDMVRRASEVGLDRCQDWEITYGPKSPCVLLGFISNDTHPAWPEFQGMSDKAAWSAAFTELASPGDFVLDPFCGVGRTAVAAANAGCLFMGSELQPARTSACLAALSGAGFGEPNKVESFPEIADSETYRCPV